METRVRGDQYQGLLDVGQKVHCMLYGGSDGVVCAINGEQRPDTIQSIAGIMTTGGNASMDVVFYDGGLSRGVPESIIRGVQWYIYPVIVTKSAIYDLMQNHNVTKAAKAEAKEREQLEREQQRQALPSEYPYLTLLSDSGKSSHATGAANLKRHLAHEFPGVKFSVKSDSFSGGDAIRVSWVDGPRIGEVDAIADMYQESDFDGMTDCSTFRHSVFTAVFGGAKYVTCSRSESVELTIRALAADGISLTPENFDKHGNLTGVDRNDEMRFYRIVREFSDYVKPVTESAEPAKAEGASVHYNENFDSYELKFPDKPAPEVLDALKANGWRWYRKECLWYHRNTAGVKEFAEAIAAG